jgi:hypothetical protein
MESTGTGFTRIWIAGNGGVAHHAGRKKNICGGTCYVNGILSCGDMLARYPIECDITKFLIESNFKMICALLSSGADMDAIKTILKINLTDVFLLQ